MLAAAVLSQQSFAPGDLDATYNSVSGDLILEWSAVNGATSYDIEMRSDSSPEWATYSDSIEEVTITLPEIASDETEYCFRVRSVTGSGVSDWSQAACVTATE